MKSVARVSLAVLLLAGFVAPVDAAPATAPTRHDDSTSTLGKPYYDFCVLSPSAWCGWSKNRWYS